MTTLPILLEEVLRFRESPSDDTADFRWTHARICEDVDRKINILGESFYKYHHISYIVQGPRDQGVDVLLKIREEGAPESYVGIQVKSYAELDDAKSDLVKQLKAGYFDAKSGYGNQLRRYYILLCGDAKKHSKRISAINAEFSRIADIRIVGPRYLHAFVTMADATVSAIVDRHLSEEDYVRKAALAEVQEYSEPSLMFLLACLTWSFENGSNQLPMDFLKENHRINAISTLYGDTAVENAYAMLQDTALETYAMEGTSRVRVEGYPAIRALYFDIQVRYEETPDELFNHLFDFLRI